MEKVFRSLLCCSNSRQNPLLWRWGIPDNHFDASWMWRKGFLARHGLSFRARTRQGQRPPADMEAVAKEFWQKVTNLKAELGVSNVYNADQTGICFEYLPKRTVNTKGSNTVWIRCGGKDKERFTAMYLARSDGVQYDPFYVMKSKPSKRVDEAEINSCEQHGFGERVWREIEQVQRDLDVIVYGNQCAWWNSSLSIAFLDHHFACRDEDEPIILLWDDFSAHWTDEVEEYALSLNDYHVPVPPGLTSVCQPWFRPLKQRLRAKWVDALSNQLQQHEKDSRNVPFKLQAPSRIEGIQWTTTAWRDLGPKVIKSGFKAATQERLDNREDHDFAEAPDTDGEAANEVVQKLESLHLVELEVSDTDDIIERDEESDSTV